MSEDISVWFRDAGEDIAIKIVYENELNELQGFVGFRRLISSENECREFWMEILAFTQSIHSQPPRCVIQGWLGKYNQPFSIETVPQTVELGVFNQWQSAGV